MANINSRKLLASFVSVAALATAGACSSGSSGGLDFGAAGGAGVDSGSGSDGGSGSSADSSSADNGAGDSGSGAGGAGGTDVAGGDSGSGSAASSDGTDVAGGGSDSGSGSAGGEDGDLETASTGTLQRVTDDAADPILTAGNALLPGAGGTTGQVGGALDSAAQQGDAALNPAGTVVVSNEPVLGDGVGGGDQLAGVSALSSPSAQGQVLTANVAENGELLNVDVTGDPLLAAARSTITSAGDTIDGQDAVTLAAGSATVGGSSDPAIGAGVLSPTQPVGSVATVGAASGSQTLTADVNGGTLTGGQQLLSGQADSLTLGSDPALVGLGVLSPTQPTGSVATVGVDSGGETATLNLGGAGLVQ